jgi:pimeloyl-ACP methyl ester carboxylesterase
MITIRNSEIFLLSLLAVTFLVILSACSDSNNSKPGATATDTGFEGAWREHECDLAIPDGLVADDFRCGTFIAPKNWDFPDGEKIGFEVAVLKARNSPAKPDPFIVFGGGPGQWNLKAAMVPNYAGSVLSPVSEMRDVIFFDKRGGGLSAPNLFCPEYFDQFFESYSVIADAEADADALLIGLQACHTRVTSEGVDVSHFNSYQVASDIAALMHALAYDTYNLYGGSYGALEVQVMVREHPESIRSFILDSPTIPDMNALIAVSFERSLGVLFDTCNASISCASMYPVLRKTLTDAVNQLNETPHYSPVTLPDGAVQDVYVTGDRLLVGLHQALYRADLIPLLPAFIGNTAAGDMSLLDAFVPQLLQTGGYDWGLYAATLCAEEVPFYDAELISEARQQLNPLFSDPLYYFFTHVRIKMCDFWQVATRSDIEIEPVISDLPALVLSGEYDPITPPSDGEKAASNLSNSHYFLFNGLGHGVLRSNAAEPGELSCAQQIVTNFLDNPKSAVDGSCAAELPGAFD